VKLWRLVVPWALLAPSAFAACTFDTNLVPFPPVSEATVDDPAIPAPEIESVNVTRGAGGGATCDQLGFVTLTLRWPRGNRLDLDKLGFEYRVLEGQAPEGLVPAGVVTAPGVSGRRVEHVLAWQDADAIRTQRIELKLEVRAVSAGGRRGQPLVVPVYGSPGR
jgi:hypothetical protein